MEQTGGHLGDCSKGDGKREGENWKDAGMNLKGRR